MDIGKTLSNLLIGTKQSKFAGIAILIAFIAITLSVLFNQNEFSLSERFMIILSVFLFSVPSVVLGLFDLTCVSGKTTEGSLCWWYGWIIAFVIIIISVIVVFSSISSLLTYNGAVSKSVKPVVNEDESNHVYSLTNHPLLVCFARVVVIIGTSLKLSYPHCQIQRK